MAYDYDKLYATTPDALGAPTDVFVSFFENLADPSLSILDLGCGQGRDALFLGRLGHPVHGVDLSEHGVADILRVAVAEGLPITAEEADLCGYTPTQKFDILLSDRTLHMLSPKHQEKVLTGLLPFVADGGLVLIADEVSNLPRFRAILESDDREWSTVKDTRGYLFVRHVQAS